MKLPKNVKVKGFPWTILPIFSTYTGHAIYPNIYIPKHIYEDLQTKHPKSTSVSILLHEQTHIKRQGKIGWLRWGLLYLLSPSFRFNEELEAIKSSMKYLRRKGGVFNTSKRAKYLSGWLYLWCMNYDKAKEELDNAWNKA